MPNEPPSLNKDVHFTFTFHFIMLILSNSRSLVAISLIVPLMVFIFLNLFALQEHLIILVTSMAVTNI